MHIIAMDWGKTPAKRAACHGDVARRTLVPLPRIKTVAGALSLAATLDGPVLIGIDAALGLPRSLWRSLAAMGKVNPDLTRGFADFLLDPNLPEAFFEPVSSPADWCPERPFIRPPSGRWSLTAYEQTSGGLYRDVDRRLGGNPIFVMSGLPGSVGSGTQALWRELRSIAVTGTRVHLWPFAGSAQTLLAGDVPVLAEMYPRACYALALGESLPAPPLKIAKTRRDARVTALARLRQAAWIARDGVTIRGWRGARDDEDRFDALLACAGLLRLCLEGLPLDLPDVTRDRVEGSVIGIGGLLDVNRQA